MVTGKPQRREHLATLFWPKVAIEQARKNLRYLLPELRHGLDDYLLITAQSIEFNRQQPYWLDVALLCEALAVEKGLSNATKVQAALDLYQGEFLAGFTVRNAPAFEIWVMHQREELQALVMYSSYQLALYYKQAGDYGAGLETTHRILQWEPWHEHAVSTLLSHYAYHTAFCGRLPAALAAAQEAQRLAMTIDDGPAQMMAYFSLSLIATAQGALSVAQARTAVGIAYCAAESPPYFTTMLLGDLGYALANASMLTEAMTTYEEALRLAEEFDLRLLKAILYYRISQMYMYLGDWASISDFVQQASTIYQALHYTPGKLQTLLAFAIYAHAVGDYEQVIHWSAQIIAQCALFQIHNKIELAAFIYQGKAQMYLGEIQPAHENLLFAVGQSEQNGNLAYQAWTKLALGELLLGQGAWQKAQVLGEAALAVTALPQAATYRMAAQTLLALIAWRRQEWQSATAYLEEIYTTLAMAQFTTQHEIPWICLHCHELWGANGDERAQEIIALGYRWLQSQAAKISDKDIRQAFLHNVPEHRKLLIFAMPSALHNVSAAVAKSSG